MIGTMIVVKEVLQVKLDLTVDVSSFHSDNNKCGIYGHKVALWNNTDQATLHGVTNCPYLSLPNPVIHRKYQHLFNFTSTRKYKYQMKNLKIGTTPSDLKEHW